VVLVSEASVLRRPAFEPVPVQPPEDRGLHGLLQLFDASWVWERYLEKFGPPEVTPDRLRIAQLTYRPGERALVAYVAERTSGEWLLEEQFAIRIRPGANPRLFRYPDDPYLPGLSAASDGLEAHCLVNQHLGLRPQRVHVQPAVYRPGSRAVLRHRLYHNHGVKATLFARVLPPERLAAFLAAGAAATSTPFATPRLVGYWQEGGVAWMSGVPGPTLRSAIRRGSPPRPRLIIEKLQGLWETPPGDGPALDLPGGFDWSLKVLGQVTQGTSSSALVESIAGRLQQFVAGWRPSCTAHNDFYDDQLIVTESGQLAVVDFEEIGLGDPMLDVGNLMAHLSWIERFGPDPKFGAYRRGVLDEALGTLGWSRDELALREGFALFRLAANPVRTLRPAWPEEMRLVLELAVDRLNGVGWES
jgi:hypothetical protein